MTGQEDSEADETNKAEREEARKTRQGWETRQANKATEDNTLEEVGCNDKAEASSRGERIRKREQYQGECEEHEYPRKKQIPKDPENDRGMRNDRRKKETEGQTKKKVDKGVGGGRDTGRRDHEEDERSTKQTREGDNRIGEKGHTRWNGNRKGKHGRRNI